jgi:DNA helicase-2/ATP-dependent DNA helicase PcrA
MSASCQEQQKSTGDRHMYASRTRFISAAILDRFDSCAWPEDPAATLGAKKATDPVDISARLRRMWR